MPGDFVKLRVFSAREFQKMVEDNDWLSNVLLTDKALFNFDGLSIPTAVEFVQSKIPELSCNFLYMAGKYAVVSIKRICNYRDLFL